MCKQLTDGQIVGEETRSFLHTDERAIVWFEIEYLEKETAQVEADWYEPNGKIYYSWWRTIEVEAGSIRTFWASIDIRGKTVEEKRGYWRVEVSHDSKLLFTEKLTIGPFYTVEIFVENLPVEYSVPLTVDGESWGAMKGGERRSIGFAPGTTHSIAVRAEVLFQAGTRYYVADNFRNVSSEDSIIFKYDLQYSLEIRTDPSGVAKISGEGWYVPRHTVAVGDAPKIIDVSPVTRWILVSWIVDGVAATERPGCITMDSSHQIVARYKKQHYLKVNSGFGDPRGEGWYDESGIAEFSVTTPTGFLIQQVFVDWTGDVSTISPQSKIVMDEPKTLTAQWRTDHTQLLVTIVVAIGGIIGLVAVTVIRKRGSD